MGIVHVMETVTGMRIGTEKVKDKAIELGRGNKNCFISYNSKVNTEKKKKVMYSFERKSKSVRAALTTHFPPKNTLYSMHIFYNCILSIYQ